MDSSILHIVPALPPEIDGLGDYATILARSLTSAGQGSRFFAARAAEFRRETLRGALACSRTTLLHYSGYGYAKKGAPFWLVHELERWRQSSDTNVLITFFHELQASGPPWTSTFWSTPLQRRVISRLTMLSDHLLTSRQESAQALRHISPFDPVHVLPILSTVGESRQPRPLADRTKRLVVFGTPGRRYEIYTASCHVLRMICRKLSIAEIVDIGAPVPLPAGLPISASGILSAEQIGVLLSDSVAGVVDYRPRLLAKSSIFASYAAFGLLPIVTGQDGQLENSDGLESKRHYLHDSQLAELTLDEAQSIASEAYRWYERHAAEAHGAAISPLIGVRRAPRAIFVSSHPIQNPVTPRLLAHRSDLRALTAYCTTTKGDSSRDDEYSNQFSFDTDLLGGYRWVGLRNYSPWPRLGRFFGLINPGVISLSSRADISVFYGHGYCTFLLGLIAARLACRAVLLSNDAVSLEGTSLRRQLKRYLLPLLYNRLSDGVLVPSSKAQAFLLSLGVSEDRVFLVPYVVDNQGLQRIAAATDVRAQRAHWGVEAESFVILFCAKFIARKRPVDLLRAFARANLENANLVFVGGGPLLEEAKLECERLGLSARAHFLGFVRYSELPHVYSASDLLVHPAELEPFGLTLNEAMICGTPVVASTSVGAAGDLIEEGITGYTFPTGDIERLAEILRMLAADREGTKTLGKRAARRMWSWTPETNVERHIEAIAETLRRREERCPR